MMLAPRNQKTVLLVEDDPWTRAVLTSLLAGEGFVILGAPTGEAGLQLAEARRPHAVVLDLALATVSGQPVLRELKRRPATAEIPVIGLIAYSAAPGRDVHPAQAIVEEPFDYDELLNHLQ